MIDHRFYLLRNIDMASLTDFYFSPGVSFGTKKLVDSGKQFIAMHYGFHFIGGIKTLIHQKLTINMSIGMGLKQTDVQKNELMDDFKKNVFSHAYSGVYPMANFMIGFQF